MKVTKSKGDKIKVEVTSSKYSGVELAVCQNGYQTIVTPVYNMETVEMIRDCLTVALNCHTDSNDVVLSDIQDQIADWFENSGIETISAKDVARLIRTWTPG